MENQLLCKISIWFCFWSFNSISIVWNLP